MSCLQNRSSTPASLAAVILVALAGAASAQEMSGGRAGGPNDEGDEAE